MNRTLLSPFSHQIIYDNGSWTYWEILHEIWRTRIYETAIYCKDDYWIKEAKLSHQKQAEKLESCKMYEGCWLTVTIYLKWQFGDRRGFPLIMVWMVVRMMVIRMEPILTITNPCKLANSYLWHEKLFVWNQMMIRLIWRWKFFPLDPESLTRYTKHYPGEKIPRKCKTNFPKPILSINKTPVRQKDPTPESGDV